jgi:hypothetical protein
MFLTRPGEHHRSHRKISAGVVKVFYYQISHGWSYCVARIGSVDSDPENRIANLGQQFFRTGTHYSPTNI